MAREKLYYTYLDECKRNYLTQIMKEQGEENFQEYSITSVTFSKEDYQNKFEEEWKKFIEKYEFDSTKALHFVDFKKLVDESTREITNPMYNYFVEDDDFSEKKLKEFFEDLKWLVESNDFFIVHTDYYWKKSSYIVKGQKIFKKETRQVAPNILNPVPYIAMKKHLDSLLLSLLQVPRDNKMYFDENLPKDIYTKLRFDADGKQFDARTDLKKAYNHTVSVGSDNVQQNVAVEVLDEIRFIRKEEVGSKYIPSHCGLELVDFLCSMIAGETRLEEYKKIYSNFEIDKGTFLNIKFMDGSSVDFYDIVMSKISRRSIQFLDY